MKLKISVLLMTLLFVGMRFPSYAQQDELQQVRSRVAELAGKFVLTPEQVRARFSPVSEVIEENTLILTLTSDEGSEISFRYLMREGTGTTTYQQRTVKSLDSSQNGFYLSFYANHTPNEYAEYRNGLPEGVYYKSFFNGAPRNLSHFSAGQLIGTSMGWNEEGETVRSDIYAEPTPLIWRGPPGTNPVSAPAPYMNVRPDKLELDTAAVGESEDRTLDVRNDGKLPLTITNLVTDNLQFTVVESNGIFTLEPNENTTIIVRFMPSECGKHEGQLKIESNDPQSLTTEIPLLGYTCDAR